MTHLRLERWCYAETATMGTLYGPSLCLYTIERPWRMNRAWVSCIPCGSYELVPTQHRGKYDAWRLRDVPGRSYINIHVANDAAHVQGCIGVGTDFGGSPWTIAGSRDAMDLLMEMVPHDIGEVTLSIAHAECCK